VQIPGVPVRALLAPATAVSLLGEMERVFVDEDNRAVLRLVKTGAARTSAGRREVEVLSGLSDGDRVVVDPPAGLREGQPLEVRP
jgi:multidrug efflux pump subunit AcrA (membrane-fusion protein)